MVDTGVKDIYPLLPTFILAPVEASMNELIWNFFPTFWWKGLFERFEKAYFLNNEEKYILRPLFSTLIHKLSKRIQ